MAIKALSYLGVTSEKIQDWSDYATKNLGMQEIDKTKNSLMLRMDDQKQRFSISNDGGEGLSFLGWEVENKSDLDNFASILDQNNVKVFRGKKFLCDKRYVEDLIYFKDPAGNELAPHLLQDVCVAGVGLPQALDDPEALANPAELDELHAVLDALLDGVSSQDPSLAGLFRTLLAPLAENRPEVAPKEGRQPPADDGVAALPLPVEATSRLSQ